MRIWSIQNIETWEVLMREGRLTAKPYHQSDNWPHAYDWMREKMCERLGRPSTSNAAPLWGWYQWCSISKRPDLRSLRHHWGPDGNHVMIECELPDNAVSYLARNVFDSYPYRKLNHYLSCLLLRKLNVIAGATPATFQLLEGTQFQELR